MREFRSTGLLSHTSVHLLFLLVLASGILTPISAQPSGEEYLIPPPGDPDFTCLVYDTNGNGARDGGESCAFRVANRMDNGTTMTIEFSSAFNSADPAKQTVVFSAGPGPSSAGGGAAPAAAPMTFFGTARRSFMRGGASIVQTLVLDTFFGDGSVRSVMLNEMTDDGGITENDGSAMLMDSDADGIQDMVDFRYMKNGMDHQMMVPLIKNGNSLTIPFSGPVMSFFQMEQPPSQQIIAPAPPVLDLNGDSMPDDNVGQPPRLGTPRANEVPTLSQWMLLVMATFLAVFGIRRIA